MRSMKVLMVFALMLMFATLVFAKDEHPVAIDGKACDTCHYTGATDENKADYAAYTQWRASSHGLNSVGCATCHGDESEFRSKPNANTCATCHTVETSTAKADKNGKMPTCASCHPVHVFTAKKDTKANHKVVKY